MIKDGDIVTLKVQRPIFTTDEPSIYLRYSEDRMVEYQGPPIPEEIEMLGDRFKVFAEYKLVQDPGKTSFKLELIGETDWQDW